MTWNLITVAFGDKKYKQGQRFLTKQASECNVNHIEYSDEDLFKSELYKEYPEWMSAENNYGWFTWKPYFILQAMENLKEGDKVFLLDTLDIFHPDIFDFVDEVMGDDVCLLPLGNFRNGDHTKKDCFVYMDCDDEDYHESKQLEAGFTFWKVCEESKKILREWLGWCLDEKVNGELTGFSNLKEDVGFQGCRHDQSILTNLAVRDGLSVIGQEIRSLIECNADYWYERYFKGQAQLYRPIDTFMVQIKDNVDYLKSKVVDSILLTTHNQQGVIKDVLNGIEKNTIGDYELVVVFDGCTDDTEKDALDFINQSSLKDKTIIKHTDNIFENRANNVGLKQCTGKYVTIVQDDQVILEEGWNIRMHKPFEEFVDVFAVTGLTAHNLMPNPNSIHLGMEEDLDNCWCDILDNVDIAQQRTISRDVFAIRGSANRGPLMIDLEDLKTLNYLDEEYAPQQLDDHDLMFRMRKELGKVCGCYWINFVSDPSWGASRKDIKHFTEANPVNAKSHHKNSKIFYNRYSSVFEDYRIIEDRELPE